MQQHWNHRTIPGRALAPAQVCGANSCNPASADGKLVLRDGLRENGEWMCIWRFCRDRRINAPSAASRGTRPNSRLAQYWLTTTTMQYLQYSEFEKEIGIRAASATHADRLRFARDTIRLLHRSVEAAVRDELTEAEQLLLTAILAGVQEDSFAGLRAQFDELHQSTCRDDVRAVELDPDITELLCAIDNLLEYAVAGDPRFIGRIAVNMVNSIDYAISGLPENIMAAPQMRDEYERQKRLLIGA